MAPLSDQVRHVDRLIRSLSRGHLERREFLMLASTCSVAAIVAACGGGSTTTQSGRVTVPFYTYENDPGSLAFVKAAIQAYEKKHPQVTISHQLLGEDQLAVFLNNAFRAHHDVGIFQAPLQNVPGWAQSGELLELDSLIKDVGPADFEPGTRMQLDGHDWWMPYQKSSSGLWYRQDVLEDVGVKAPPASYDDLISVLKEVNGRNGLTGIATGMGSGAEDALWAMHAYIQQGGWGYFTREGDLTFDRPEVYDGIMRFINVLTAGAGKRWANIDTTEITEAFVTGRAVFARWSGRIGPTVVQRNPKIAAVTGFMGPEPGGPWMTGRLNLGFGQGYCIAKRTASTEHAVEFLKSMTTGDLALTYALNVPGQYLPPLNSVQKKFLDPDNEMVKENSFMQNARYRGWVNKLVEGLQWTTNPTGQMGAVANRQFHQVSNVNPIATQIWKTNPIDGVMVQQIVINGTNPRDAWKQASTQMGQTMKAWRADHPNWKPNQ